jgi:copper chaperone CopZ
METTGLTQEIHFQSNRKPTDVEADLSVLDGVRDVESDENTHTFTVRFDPTIISEIAIREAAKVGAGES